MDVKSGEFYTDCALANLKIFRPTIFRFFSICMKVAISDIILVCSLAVILLLLICLITTNENKRLPKVP